MLRRSQNEEVRLKVGAELRKIMEASDEWQEVPQRVYDEWAERNGG
jgi:hypothetical protein